MVDVNEKIKNIEINRKELNRLMFVMSNADFRLHQTPNDEMWIRIKEQKTEEANKICEQISILFKEVLAAKNAFSLEEWNHILTKLGTVMAATENIEFVSNNLNDEFELKKAINQGSKLIEQKVGELDKAKQDNNQDLVTYLEAQINFLVNDMQKHDWGRTRIEEIFNNYSIQSEEVDKSL